MSIMIRQFLRKRLVAVDCLAALSGRFWLLASLLGALCLASPVQAQVSGMDTNLVLRFDFDQLNPDWHVPDVSGHGSDGWQFNQTNLLSVGNGVFGSTAAQFTYAGYISNDLPSIYHFSQYIAVTNVAAFEYLTNGTISLWVRFDAQADFAIYLLDSGYDYRFVSDRSAASNSWTLGRNVAANLSLFAYPSTGDTQMIAAWPDDTVRSGGSTPDLSTTSFHLYTATIDCPGNRAVAYYDGVPYMTNTINLPWLRIYGCSSMRWLCVGASSHDGTPFWADDFYPNAGYFVGRLDDFRIYTRTLSASEVQGLYFGAGTGAFSQNVSVRPGPTNSIQLTFSSRSNTLYQAESRTELTTGAWQPLGVPVRSSGTTVSINDSLSAQGHRFYRVRPLP